MSTSQWSAINSLTTKASYNPTSEEAILIASDRDNSNNFGYSTDITADGTRVIIGAYYALASGYTQAGKAYVFS